MADDGYRHCLQQAIAVITSEAGYTSISSLALETITEMIQSVLCEIGRCSQSFCEISSRTKPTLCDVEQTLINTVGFTIQDVANYYLHAPTRKITSPEKLNEKSQPKLMTVGTPLPLPSYIPDHLPPLPSPHTYIRTPTYKFPSTEYATVRKKRSESVRCSRNSLIKFIVKTSGTLSLVHEDLNEKNYVKNKD
ncbi:uncharacterized protein TRIADDRAFT_52057 [Trichoplax adhaerens]|uniref:Transcription initiation factor TFIID subunit 8 n=1 Tax=Trichoplax adhaerens TaxID=10228 RepID=B3RLM7_TRIAD|nr:hypothetical protein TRIADDRAFT_52057 [Trichoplax adhaerens]EDV28809.1 hypothetical protein TRIADDRAFT_52057 [Trichoplax adhaerens]|eukprot:XP_002108011.1 hypothetical protein TRIADDRAFT_52057 [Trichoplax adhaerens]